MLCFSGVCYYFLFNMHDNLGYVSIRHIKILVRIGPVTIIDLSLLYISVQSTHGYFPGYNGTLFTRLIFYDQTSVLIYANCP